MYLIGDSPLGLLTEPTRVEHDLTIEHFGMGQGFFVHFQPPHLTSIDFR